MSGYNLRSNKRKNTEDGEGAPKRQKTSTWLQDYWDAFEADRNDDWNDGAQDCGAKLHYLDDSGQAQFIAGGTGSGAGHAEMHALTQFIRNVCNSNMVTLKTYIDRGPEIECTAKACCVRCSIVLGALGFSGRDVVTHTTTMQTRIRTVTRGDRQYRRREQVPVTHTSTAYTYKSMKRMGSTEWSMPPDIRTFLAGYLRITEQDVLNIRDLYGF